MTVQTVRQTDMQTRPGKKFYYKEYSKQQPKGRICIRPSRTFIVQGILPDDCSCTIVWHNTKRIGQTEGWKELKYVHKTCPHHGGGRVECDYEIAN
jgi:hypothetical protein